MDFYETPISPFGLGTPEEVSQKWVHRYDNIRGAAGRHDMRLRPFTSGQIFRYRHRADRKFLVDLWNLPVKYYSDYLIKPVALGYYGAREALYQGGVLPGMESVFDSKFGFDVMSKRKSIKRDSDPGAIIEVTPRPPKKPLHEVLPFQRPKRERRGKYRVPGPPNEALPDNMNPEYVLQWEKKPKRRYNKKLKVRRRRRK